MTYPDLCPPLPGVEPDAFYAAQEMVRGYCGWHIAPSVEETLTLDGSGSYLLMLPSLHVTAVTAVTQAGTAVDPFTWSEAGILEQLVCWSTIRRDVTVSLTHGYEVCPVGVRSVLQHLARSGGRVAESVQVGQVRVSNTLDSSGLDVTSRAALDRYRIL